MDCILEYHALTGYENKRTIVKENSQMHQRIILIGFNILEDCLLKINQKEVFLENLGTKFVSDLGTFSSYNKWIKSEYSQVDKLDERIKEINEMSLEKEMEKIKLKKLILQENNSEFKQSINQNIKVIEKEKINLSNIFDWSEIKNEKIENIKEKDKNYVYFFEKEENKLIEDKIKVYRKGIEEFPNENSLKLRRKI
uniref:Uncharacterized protein n=1 Tax=Meloidogyne enterolobii TaxID=390850 RepID=A0A6V7X350_MELEN|nr:unnamed protein product [Meloidogyne enterolobii]